MIESIAQVGKRLHATRSVQYTVRGGGTARDLVRGLGVTVRKGHLPGTLFIAGIAVLVACLTGRKYIVLANERSADCPNLWYDGLEVNHQFTKSLEFETGFGSFLSRNVHPDLHAISLLRPLYDMQVMREFCLDPAYRPYRSHFVSCNSNASRASHGWCGACAKCAFVFLCLSAFLGEEAAMNVVGTNCLRNPDLVGVYQALCALERQRPLECVGTPDEVLLAFGLVAERGSQSLACQQLPQPVRMAVEHKGGARAVASAVFGGFGPHRLPSAWEPAVRALAY